MSRPSEKITVSGRCPLCGAAAVKDVFAAERWRIASCTRCTNAWTVPPPGPVDYAAGDFHALAAGKGAALEQLEDLPPAWRRSVLSQVALLQAALAPGASILEVGCGSGVLLAALREAGFKVEGLEPSGSAVERARSRGLTVRHGCFPSPAETDGRAAHDCLIFSHVLEHLANPGEVLREVIRAAPGGKLLLVQTNWLGLVPRWQGERWYAWVPEQHFWHFTPHGLLTLAEPLGFSRSVCEYSRLVQTRRTARILSAISEFRAEWRDQFHLLLHVPERPPENKG